MNQQRDAFALSNNPSKTAFQPIEKENQFEPRRRSPTTITFKASKAILRANRVKKDQETNLKSSNDHQLNDELFKNLDDQSKFDDRPSSNSEPLPYPSQDCTSRSSNCSNQSVFSDEISCLTFNDSIAQASSNLDTVKIDKFVDKFIRLDSNQSINSSSFYQNTDTLNKHLLISNKHSPQLLIGCNQLPGGICCVLTTNKSMINSGNRSINEETLTNDNQELYSIFDRIEEEEERELLSPDKHRDNFEFLELPKRTKKRKMKSKNRSPMKSHHHHHLDSNLEHQRLTDHQSLNNMKLEMTNEMKPQFRFTRYDTVEEDGGNHIKLMAIDHLPTNQMIFQTETGEIANLNQARLIKTNLLKQPHFSKSTNTKTTNQIVQPNTNNINSILVNSMGQSSNLSNLTNLTNQNGLFTIIPSNQNKTIGFLTTSTNKKCACNQQTNSQGINQEINNNVCLDCENTKKILQSNLVQLIPLNNTMIAGQSSSTSNSNISPLSIQISPLSSANSIQTNYSNTVMTGQPINQLSNQLSNLPLTNAQTVSAPMQTNQSANVFSYDAATIHQYALSLNNQLCQQQQHNQLINDSNLQDRTSSSLSGITDPMSQSLNSKLLNSNVNLPSMRSVSSCAQYNIIPNTVNELDQKSAMINTNQFQPITSNHSQSEQNLISNQNQITNQMINNQQYHSQPQIYHQTAGITTSINNPNFNNQIINQNLNQINNGGQINKNFNRPYRLSFRTPSPTLLTSSSIADSNLESPSATYCDNNDSVNIFNKYQLSASSDAYWRRMAGPKEHDFFRYVIFS